MIVSEALTLYIRSWLASSHPIPPEAFAAAQAKGLERYENFVDALAQRLHQGKSLAKEIPEDVFSGSYVPSSGEEVSDGQL